MREPRRYPPDDLSFEAFWADFRRGVLRHWRCMKWLATFWRKRGRRGRR